MRLPSFESLTSASWYAYSDEPISTGHWYSGGLCDPYLIMRDESPDGIWHLFAHTWAGIMHYTSSSGLDWKEEHLAILRGHSPYIYRIDDTYLMLYETHDKPYQKAEDKSKVSRIEMVTSSDLRLWSKPRVLLTALSVPYSATGERRRLSSPQLVSYQGRLRLYFGAGETIMYDSKRHCSVYFGYAESESITAPFVPSPEPLMTGDPDGSVASLALGNVRIIPCADGFAALASSYSYLKAEKRSTATLQLYTSFDGLNFNYSRTLITPSKEGWMSSYITSASAKYSQAESSWYCYFSAEEKKSFIQKHTTGGKLGLLLGRVIK